jgi:hypothetical protein
MRASMFSAQLPTLWYHSTNWLGSLNLNITVNTWEWFRLIDLRATLYTNILFYVLRSHFRIQQNTLKYSMKSALQVHVHVRGRLLKRWAFNTAEFFMRFKSSCRCLLHYKHELKFLKVSAIPSIHFTFYVFLLNFIQLLHCVLHPGHFSPMKESWMQTAVWVGSKPFYMRKDKELSLSETEHRPTELSKLVCRKCNSEAYSCVTLWSEMNWLESDTSYLLLSETLEAGYHTCLQ